MKLHLGCGGRRKDGFVNIDIRPGGAVDIVWDLAKEGLPNVCKNVTRVETYHFLEHIHRDDAARVLRQCFDVMVPGGILVVEVPDLQEQCRRVLTGDTSVVKNIYGLQRADRPELTDIHRWGYTHASLGRLLTEIGFVVTLEAEGTDYHAKDEPCLRIEARKP